MPPFQYQPLRQSKQEIRLLNISAAPKRNKFPSFSLEVVSLQSSPSYTALSYTWGDASKTTPLHIHNQVFQATHNLYEALQHLTQSGKLKKLWVDAICINQKDDEEKSWQVAQMIHIYRNAAETILWLGPACLGSDLLMDKMQALGHDAVRHGVKVWEEDRLKTTQAFKQAMSYGYLGGLPGAEKEGTLERFLSEWFRRGWDVMGDVLPPTPLKEILSRPWWKRVWILQEVTVSKKPVFTCGHKSMSFETMYAALSVLEFFQDAWKFHWSADRVFARLVDNAEGLMPGGPEEPGRSLYEGLETHYRIFVRYRDLYHDEGPLPLHGLLSLASGIGLKVGLLATDPRDLVYALLGICSNAQELGLVPDYAKSCRMVYLEVAVALRKHGVNLLPWCLDTLRRDEDAIPSWVPDWRAGPRYSAYKFVSEGPMCEFSAWRGTTGKWSYNPAQPDVLIRSLSFVDSIADTIPDPFERGSSESSPKFDEFSDPADPCVQSAFLKAEKFVHSCGHDVIIPHNYDKRDIVWRILTADRIIKPTHLREIGFQLAPSSYANIRQMYTAILESKVKEYVKAQLDESVTQSLLDMIEGRASRAADGAFVQFPSELSSPGAVDFATFTRTAGMMLYKRCLAKSTQGFLCLAPEGTQPGDRIVVIHGTGSPYIVRPVGEMYNRIVGEAYVLGIMYGELSMLDVNEYNLAFI
ncbi:HET-domain-containing protein [Amniculicola lignicola CBS 123094]|uniref:HET-domain-containing protein n=1 Tax=Amniculicola lignicola CBS 123094 TaxID=1392246 RepID=A0A6A5WNJ0_9PLEO|nr:HET-domain-containing protein [Amniculicola lignicola CBS 123094]